MLAEFGLLSPTEHRVPLCSTSMSANRHASDGTAASTVCSFVACGQREIYCRPVCPVKPAKSANVTFYPSAAAAELAGFRPCLRCRPEAAPFSPAWMGTRTTVERALRLIADGALDGGNVEALAGRLRNRLKASVQVIPETPRRKPGAGRSNHPRAAGQAASRRDRSHGVEDSCARWFRQLASVQHRVCRSIPTSANGDQARSQPKQFHLIVGSRWKRTNRQPSAHVSCWHIASLRC